MYEMIQNLLKVDQLFTNIFSPYLIENCVCCLCIQSGGHKEMSSILADQLRQLSLNPGGGVGDVAGSQLMSTAVHKEPK